jgi:hypothetical protein
MALRYSTAIRNFMAAKGSLKQALQGGRIEIYTGAQPATADSAVTGTLLCTITNNSAAITNEVLASGSVTLTAGAAGSVDSISVNGVNILGTSVPFNTSLTQTASDVAAQCENYQSAVDYDITSSGAVITITARPGTGVNPNGFAVAATSTTITTSVANMAGGVAGVNGLLFGAAASAVLSKLSSQSWTGVNGVSGTAGWYRMYGSVADTGGTDSATKYNREDGAIATSGAELNLSSTALSATATTTISTWTRTLPTL